MNLNEEQHACLCLHVHFIVDMHFELVLRFEVCVVFHCRFNVFVLYEYAFTTESLIHWKFICLH